jgi:hypothetical protein
MFYFGDQGYIQIIFVQYGPYLLHVSGSADKRQSNVIRLLPDGNPNSHAGIRQKRRELGIPQDHFAPESPFPNYLADDIAAVCIQHLAE